MTQRRRRFRKVAPPPSLSVLAAADGVEVDDLLREVSRFRLALDTDLTIAAAAADAVADRIAPIELSDELTTQAVDAGRLALDELVTRQRLDGTGRPRRRRFHGVPLVGAGPLVGLAIVLGLGTGFVANQLASGPRGPSLANAASSSLMSLSTALNRGNDRAARQAGNELSAAIGSLIAAAPGNPAAAQEAANALMAEQTLLSSTTGPLGAQLRASMTAQVTALQNTVHTRLPLVQKLPTAASQLVIPALPVLPSAARRVVPGHPAGPGPSLVLGIPGASSSPGVLAIPDAAASPSTATSPTAADPTTTSPTASGSPSQDPSAGPVSPLPLTTETPGGFGLPH